jgi:NTE family protein
VLEIFPFKNLVLQGGGVRAFAYHGVLQVLDERGILSQIERVGGSSAGALTAMLLSFRLSAAETIKLFNSIDFQRVTTREANQRVTRTLRTPRAIEDQLERVRGNVDALNRLFRHYGWYTYDYPQEWLYKTIAAHCAGNPRVTFADFRECGFRDLYVVATNLTQHQTVVFCADNTPDVAVADAVVMSGLIPLFFEAVRFDGSQLGQGDFYADGGILDNYPIHVFDHLRFAEENSRFVYGVNWETLGCRLCALPDCVRHRQSITNILGYVQNLFEVMIEAQQVIYANNPVDQLRSINIDDCCVSTTDFQIIPGEHPKYAQLVEAGRSATRDYLAHYRLPTDRFFDVKLKFAEFLSQWRQGRQFRV